MHEPSRPSPPPPPHANGALPAVRTTLAPEEILDRLDRTARRGRLPGFQRGGRGLFSVEAHGYPFDAELIAREAPAGGQGRDLRFRVRMRRRLPLLFALVLAATVWPGVYFMDQLIPGEWGLPATWMWYLPLTILPLPWVWAALLRRSRQSNRAAAREAVRRIGAELGAPVDEPQPTPR